MPIEEKKFNHVYCVFTKTPTGMVQKKLMSYTYLTF